MIYGRSLNRKPGQPIEIYPLPPSPWDRSLIMQLNICHSLTHWGRMAYICVGKLTIIVSDNGLSPGRRQAIVWTNAEILLIGRPRTYFIEILIEIQIFPLTNMLENAVCEMLSILSRPQCVLKRNLQKNIHVWNYCMNTVSAVTFS